MKTIKLSEWCEKTGVKYLTAWRWFKNNQMPVHAYQTETGTILVQDEDERDVAPTTTTNDAVSLFLKKTVEYSKNNSSVEDFAAYVISNFQLKLQGSEKTESKPFYSRNKPKSEEIQKHFQQFIPAKENQDRLKQVKTLLSDGQAAGNIVPAEMSDLLLDPNADPADPRFDTFCAKFGATTLAHLTPPSVEELAIPNVDCVTTNTIVDTPQAINFTGSTHSQFFNQGGSSLGGDIGSNVQLYTSANSMAPSNSIFSSSAISNFQPTQKEMQSAVKVAETASTNERPRKRGRKPSKKA